MNPNGHIPPLEEGCEAGGVPPRLPALPQASSGPRPPLLAPARSASKSRPLEHVLATLLSLFLGLFLLDAILSLTDDSFILFLHVHGLTPLRGILAFFGFLAAGVLYVLMALTPLIPKRLFVPLTLFNPAAALFPIPLLIYFYDRMHLISWGVSLCQVILAFGMLLWIQGGIRFRWPIVGRHWLEGRVFTWRNLLVFSLTNTFVLLPAVVVYLAVCASLAVNHFSDGFVSLHSSGLAVEVHTYKRDDGKTIQLVPMSHIGDAAFYRQLTQSFPTNAMILMEGVTDEHDLLTNKVSYKRMARSLGLAEQQREFKPDKFNVVYADVDVSQFTTNTIDFLNLIMLVHAKGLNAENLLQLLHYNPPPGFEPQLYNDILHLRNRHLLSEINTRLSDSDDLIVPWGAAHMPEIAREIQKLGFRLARTKEYMVIRFWLHGGHHPQPTDP